MAKLKPIERFINVITDQAVRAWVYKEARRLLPNIGARCAITQYLFLYCAGLEPNKRMRRPVPTFTTQIEAILINELNAKRITDKTQLRRGDIAFSRNCNSTPGPDHVYAIHGVLPDCQTAVVIDNYAVGPHQRNLGHGPKTPFDFALRLP